MELASTLAFVMCAALLVYVHIGYPLVMVAWARMRPGPVPQRSGTPSATVVVVACNEGHRIGARLANLLALDYPHDRYKVILASDGSEDNTVAQARAYESDRVRVIAFSERRGKAAVFADIVPLVDSEIIVFTDARQYFEEGTLRALVAPFADPSVGAVGGELVFDPDKSSTQVGEGVGIYWRLEQMVRRAESLVDSTVGASGAIYAVRRALVDSSRIAADTVLDDVLIPMRVVRSGYRVIFEQRARAHDQAAHSSGQEFERKVRTIAGCFQLFARERWLRSPFHNRIWFQTISHKGLRLISPLLLFVCLGANLSAQAAPAGQTALVAQGIFYLAALIGGIGQSFGYHSRLCSAAYVFCLLNWATVIAFVRFATGHQPAAWRRAMT